MPRLFLYVQKQAQKNLCLVSLIIQEPLPALIYINPGWNFSPKISTAKELLEVKCVIFAHRQAFRELG